MKTARPEQIDTRGRLDLLAYRIAERIAPRVVYAAEWQTLKNLVWQTCQRVLGNAHDRSH